MFSLVMIGQMSSPSTGNFPGPGSDGSTPARLQKVVYQSATCMKVSVLVPLTLLGRSPPLAKAKDRTPPSKK